jgi:hypothetical protein
MAYGGRGIRRRFEFHVYISVAVALVLSVQDTNIASHCNLNNNHIHLARKYVIQKLGFVLFIHMNSHSHRSKQYHSCYSLHKFA